MIDQGPLSDAEKTRQKNQMLQKLAREFPAEHLQRKINSDLAQAYNMLLHMGDVLKLVDAEAVERKNAEMLKKKAELGAKIKTVEVYIMLKFPGDYEMQQSCSTAAFAAQFGGIA
jgi:hypothetical protein